MEISPIQFICRLLSVASGSSAICFQVPHWIIPQKERCKKEKMYFNPEEIARVESIDSEILVG